MTNEKKQIVLAIMRVEYSHKSVEQIRREYARKLLVKELHMFGHVVTKSEITDLFEELVAERGTHEMQVRTDGDSKA